jgi:putative hemolysin
MQRRSSLAICLIGVAVLIAACQPGPDDDGEQPGIANPASEYCEAEGGELELRADEDGGQLGVCVFPDGSECEEWAFFRGECEPGGGAVGLPRGSVGP